MITGWQEVQPEQLRDGDVVRVERRGIWFGGALTEAVDVQYLRLLPEDAER